MYILVTKFEPNTSFWGNPKFKFLACHLIFVPNMKEHIRVDEKLPKPLLGTKMFDNMSSLWK